MSLPAVKLTFVTFNHIKSIFQAILEKRRGWKVSGKGRQRAVK